MYGLAKAATVAVAAYLAVSAATAAEPAADVAARIEAARAFNQKGDIARAAHELETALIDLQNRLGRGFSDDMPPPPAGWQAEDPEIQGLGAVGGGLSVTRAYTRNDASLNASIILDSPAVEAAGAQFANPVPLPGVKRIKVNGEDAMLRWDNQARSGEITIVLGGRVLLQIEGDSLPSPDLLPEVAKTFKIAAIRKLAGL